MTKRAGAWFATIEAMRAERMPARALPLLALALFPAGQAAQPGEVRIRYGLYAPEPPVISVEANLVELAVTVRDGHGQATGGFSASDFQVLDNGKPRPISFFSELKAPPPSAATKSAAAAPASSVAPASAQPARSIALFVDDTHINLFGLGKAKAAAQKFVENMLPADRVALYTGSASVTVDFTASQHALLAGIAALRVHPQRGDRGFTVCPVLSGYEAYAIARHADEALKRAKVQEAIACNCLSPDPACIAEQPAYVQTLAETVWNQLNYQSTTALDVLGVVIRQLARMPGSRILAMLSPGFPTGGLEQRASAVLDAALRARVTINAIDSEGLTTRFGPRQQIVTPFLVEAAAATGGQFLENTNDITGGFLELTTPPRVSYLLGFSPEKAPDGTYHRLAVKLPNRAGLHVETRAGYFAAAPQRLETARQRIDRAMLSADAIGDVPATVRVSAGAEKNGRYTITVLTAIDARRLKFSRQSNRNLQELTFATVLEDARGNYIAGKLAVMDLLLSRASLDDFESKGIKATLSFTAPKGSYQVREVVREVVENRLAAATTPIDLR